MALSGLPATGPWRIRCRMWQRFADAVGARARSADDARTSSLGRWDSVLPAFLFELAAVLRGRGGELVADGAPEGLRRLLAIALAVPPRAGAAPSRAARTRWRGSGSPPRPGGPALSTRSASSAKWSWRCSRSCAAGHSSGSRTWRGCFHPPGRGPADRHADRAARRLHPGLRRRQRAGAVRRADLRRQPGHHRHGAGDGPADGGGDHGRPHRGRVRRRARHDAGQPGDRRAAHARHRSRPVPGRAANAGVDADAAAARLLRHADGHPRRRRSSASPSSGSIRCNMRSRCG